MGPRRYVWHQRLAWLLMLYLIAALYGFAEAASGKPSRVSLLARALFACALVMVCVKDAALAGRPVPYSLRLPIAMFQPVGPMVVEVWARRWWGVAWIVLHAALLYGVALAGAALGLVAR